jgi:4-amino-4-deoxy-L-arabinose transferase-like glycosyltransferase
VALLAAFAWLPPLGMHDYWFPDEPDVALPIVEMFARGDWIVPTENGLPWLDYPVLTYWGGLFWSHLLGLTPFALRLTPLLGGAAFLLSTVWIARTIAGRTAAWYAVLAAVAAPLVWMMATTLQVDMVFAGTQAAGYALYVAGDARRGRAAVLLRMAAFLAFGLAILAKGPLGLLLPGLILTLWHAWNREWTRILWLAPLALLALAVAALWYVPLIGRLGWDYVGNELWLQNFDRFGTTTRGHGGHSVFYYFTSLFGDLGPWTLLLAGALWQSWRQRSERGVRLLGLWFLVSILFLSAASTKRSVYLLPAYPAIFVLIGWWVAGRTQALWLRACLAITAAFFAASAIALLVWRSTHYAQLPQVARILPALASASNVLAVLFAAGALLTALALWRRELQQGVRACAATLLLAFIAAMWLIMPVIDRVRNYEMPTAWLMVRSPDRGPMGFFAPGLEVTKRAGWLCYLHGRHLQFLSSPEEARQWLQENPQRLLLSDPETSPAVPGTRVLNRWMIGEQKWIVLAADVPPTG